MRMNLEELFLDGMGYVLLIVHLVFLLSYWEYLPDLVPIHFSLSGAPDGWGARRLLMLIPGLAIVETLILGWVARHPERHNYLWPVHDQNRVPLYRLSRLLVLRLRVFVSLMLAMISATSAGIALQSAASLGWWFVPGVLLAFGISMGDYFVRGREIARGSAGGTEPLGNSRKRTPKAR